MNIFGIGLPEMAVIAAIGLLVFGPKRLPELGKTLGRTLKGFQSASRDFEQEFRRAIDTESAVTETVAAETLARAEAAAIHTAATDSQASQQPGPASATQGSSPVPTIAAPSAASDSPPA
jgi:sec-independent protein translocase protein TatA